MYLHRLFFVIIKLFLWLSLLDTPEVCWIKTVQFRGNILLSPVHFDLYEFLFIHFDLYEISSNQELLDLHLYWVFSKIIVILPKEDYVDIKLCTSSSMVILLHRMVFSSPSFVKKYNDFAIIKLILNGLINEHISANLKLYLEQL